jgi:hypothetical protein
MWGIVGIASPFLTSQLDVSKDSASRLCRFTPGKNVPVPIGQEAGWAPELVWMLWTQTRVDQPVARRYTDSPRIL